MASGRDLWDPSPGLKVSCGNLGECEIVKVFRYGQLLVTKPDGTLWLVASDTLVTLVAERMHDAVRQPGEPAEPLAAVQPVERT